MKHLTLVSPAELLVFIVSMVENISVVREYEDDHLISRLHVSFSSP